MTTIALAGLANSHPLTDARHLRELRPSVRLLAWDPSPQRCALFLAEQPEATLVDTFEELLAPQPDVVIVTRPPSEVADIVAAALEAGSAVSITKPAATSRSELEALETAIAGREERVFTTSILRFAPDLDGLPAPIRSVHVVAQHHIDYWLDPAQRWQDEAGGLVPMMGVHAFELLECILGPTMHVTSCGTQRRSDWGLTSPDLAVGTVTADGVAATFEIDGLGDGQAYSVEVETLDHTVVRRVLGESGGDDPLGYRRVTSHVLAMADGAPSPLPWQRSTAVLQAVVEAREHAEGNQP